MVQITRALVDLWDASPLAGAQALTDPLNQDLITVGNTVERTVTELNWEGQAKDAADQNALSQNQELRRVGQLIANLGTTVTGAEPQLTTLISKLKTTPPFWKLIRTR